MMVHGERTFPTDGWECPECHVVIPIRKSVYKHAIGCLNLTDKGITAILREHNGNDSEHSRRVVLSMREAERRSD